jgi:hypothetical protein
LQCLLINDGVQLAIHSDDFVMAGIGSELREKLWHLIALLEGIPLDGCSERLAHGVRIKITAVCWR